MSKILHQYQNGNVQVTVHEDGTKVREWEGEQVIDHPESCDLKVTQYCDLDNICVFCHEMSNKQGKHGDLELIKDVWASQPAGTELAIGGGNPLAHPDIDSFLRTMSGRGIIPNLTMNTLHLKKFADQLRALQEDKAIYGLGISYRGRDYMKLMPETIKYDNAVFHLILGLNDLTDCSAVISWCKERQIKPKILLLGYKQFGNGVKCYSPELQEKIDAWKQYVKVLLKTPGLTVSFDNLAITQIGLQNHMSKEDWELFYCGDDGTHTNYCDAIKKEFAKTSTSVKRYPLSMVNNTREMMEIIHEEIRQEKYSNL